MKPIPEAFEIAHPQDAAWLVRTLAPVPECFRAPVRARYTTKLASEGRRGANLYALDVADRFKAAGPDCGADEWDIRAAADRAVRHVKSRAPCHGDGRGLADMLEGAARRYSVPLPEKFDPLRLCSRMTSVHWWRRKLRARFRRAEAAARAAGLVGRGAGLYLSEGAFQRHLEQTRLTLAVLEALEAYNETTGEAVPLLDAINASVANPTLRRAELMTRARGLEEWATSEGLVPTFWTLTSPGRMHCVTHDGRRNPNWDGTDPAGAQRHLNATWQRARADLDRQGIGHAGFRVAEPHHDGTPHWHGLSFTRPEHVAPLLVTLRKHALRDSPEEPGAQEHRFQSVPYDPAKGKSAVGYTAKYIAKNVDGYRVGEDYEGGIDANLGSTRAVAWARTYRIRQFQFFGTPSVTVWRELRRLPEERTPLAMAEHRAAADAGEWGRFMRAMDALPLRPWWERGASPSYPGETMNRVRGLVASTDAGHLVAITRPDAWTIREKCQHRKARTARLRHGSHAAPWGVGGAPRTCVNNCTPRADRASAGDSATWSGWVSPHSPVPDAKPAAYYEDLRDIGGLMVITRPRPHPEEPGETVNALLAAIPCEGYRIGSFREEAAREPGPAREEWERGTRATKPANP